MRNILTVLVIFFLVSISQDINAQSAEDVARRELERRGLGDEEVRERLLARGIDVNTIDINNPSEIFKLEKTLKEVVDEMEKEKLNENTTSTSNDPTVVSDLSEEETKILAKEGEEISDAIDEGATLEEAVSEQLIDAKEGVISSGALYGQDIFRNQSIKLYRQSQDVKPPNSYVLGVGDIISVSIWGYSEEDIILEVNNDGYVKPTAMPRIYLKGLRLGDARDLLRTRFSNYYRFDNNQFEVALNYGRTINVSIVGEVYNYGSFNIPAINTAFNALVAAGGPSNIGSVRNILLKRSGVVDRQIDVYKYLSDPSFASDFYLEEGDIIYVPVIGKVVSINGAIKRPNKFELKKNEGLNELIEYAGGLSDNANVKNVQISRFEGDSEKIIDINLDQYKREGKNFAIKSGDKITINAISSNLRNFVTISGALDLPGNYALVDGEKISDVLQRVKLEDNAMLDFAYLQRKNLDGTTSYIRVSLQEALDNTESISNIELQKGDKIAIYNKEAFVNKRTFTVQGAVKNPNTFSFDNSETLKIYDAIVLAGGLKPYATDFAYVQSPDMDDPSRLNYERIDIKAIMDNPSSLENKFLNPDSKIVVYNKETFLESREISIEGFVKNPRSFKYDPSLTIKDVIEMAGGLTQNASRKRIDLYRLQVDSDNGTKTLAARIGLNDQNEPIQGNTTLQPDDLIIVRSAEGYEPIKTVKISGEVAYPGSYAIIGDNEKFASIVERAGGLTPEAFDEGIYIYRASEGVGFITIDGKKALNSNSKQNLILKNRDEIYIPKTNSIVKIIGETNLKQNFNDNLPSKEREINVPFDKNRNALWYVNEYAGGIDNDGDKSKITVKYANGRIETVKRRFLFFKDYPDVRPGATILVPSKPIEDKSQREKTDWTGIMQDVVTQATAILTLLLLVDRLD